ncbi:MAG TPA: D-glycero-beta-D-manno-heptose 1-phosphate adenylyltransferase [Gemmatimonadota bacterium]|nr:D-glycero-beta-D-manno-heptose 1-phosphate adenylyltransferase [Gemmatimonadota bacterium]
MLGAGPTDPALREALRAWQPARILVYGDLMLDEYIFGRADRLSPEKPVPIVALERREEQLGGAGNVVRNLQALGCEPVLVALVGDDPTGRACRAHLAAAGLTTEGLVEEPGRSTPRKIRVHAGQHALVRIDDEGAEGSLAASRHEVAGRLRCLAPSCAAAIVSDYRKGAVTSEGMEVLAEASRGKRIVVDPKGPDAERYRGAGYLLPNERELADLLGGAWEDAGAEALRRRLGLRALVLTRSERGVRLYQGGPPIDCAARPRQVFDVTGAGDTFAAIFTAFLAAGQPVAVAARLANLAAGIKVGKVGTATVSRQELENELNRDLPAPVKRVDLAMAAVTVAARRARGETIVFTNGCFDLLHAGHIRLLEASRALGDCLIVGLNSDRSVGRLKGPGRPVLDASERAEVLGALSCVDYVVVFDEETPIRLIEAIRPDILTKGADYAPHEVVGAEAVRSWGGRVEILELLAGKSSSGIIGRIAERTRN